MDSLTRRVNKSDTSFAGEYRPTEGALKCGVKNWKPGNNADKIE